jgi:hypothetical protein
MMLWIFGTVRHGPQPQVSVASGAERPSHGHHRAGLLARATSERGGDCGNVSACISACVLRSKTTLWRLIMGSGFTAFATYTANMTLDTVGCGQVMSYRIYFLTDRWMCWRNITIHEAQKLDEHKMFLVLNFELRKVLSSYSARSGKSCWNRRLRCHIQTIIERNVCCVYVRQPHVFRQRSKFSSCHLHMVSWKEMC